MRGVSDYIVFLADASLTPQHELLLECMDYYNITGLKDLTLSQAKEFCELVRDRRQ